VCVCVLIGSYYEAAKSQGRDSKRFPSIELLNPKQQKALNWNSIFHQLACRCQVVQVK